MNKIREAHDILNTLGLPPAQQDEMSALTLLALCGLSKRDEWNLAQRHSMGVTKGIMSFVAEKYGKKYAPNTRETFRRQVLHQFVQARIADYNPDNPQLATNSPQAHYALTEEALKAIKTYGTDEWISAAKAFVDKYGALVAKYARERNSDMIPVTLSKGLTLQLSPGKHNEVQAAIILEFAPRFAHGAALLYLGDTSKKNLFVDTDKLVELGIPITDHSKLPDVILYDGKKEWLYLVEAVTSHGPISPKRVLELEDMLVDCKIGKIYITAFPDFTEFRKHTGEIAWDTEVWIKENPDHMIHYNGDRFIGPRNK